jgi:WD40 repeat protein
MIALIYAEGRVVVREISSGTIIFDQILPTEYLLIRARVAWSPTGDRLAAGVASHVYIWNTDDFMLTQSLMAGSEDALVYQEQDIYYPAGFYDVEWSYDGEFLFSSSVNTRYTIWSFQNNVFIVDQIIGGNPSPAVLFANDQRISIGSHYFDIQTQTFTRLDVSHYYCTRPTVTMASNSTRTLLVIGGLRGCVSELDPIMGQETIFYQLYEDGDVRDVAWSPDNSMIAAIDTAGRLYQIERTSAEFIVLADIETELYAVAWSPDGEQIAYGGAPLDSGEDSFSVFSLLSNLHPTTDAGADQTLTSNTTNTATVTLDGSILMEKLSGMFGHLIM